MRRARDGRCMLSRALAATCADALSLAHPLSLTVARGTYNASTSFVDDDKKEHLSFSYKLKIAKDWAI